MQDDFRPSIDVANQIIGQNSAVINETLTTISNNVTDFTSTVAEQLVFGA